VSDAGLTLSDIDGLVSYFDPNEPVRLSAALGLGDLCFTAQSFGGGGSDAASAVSLAAAAIAAGSASTIEVFRAIAQGQFKRYGRPHSSSPSRGQSVHRSIRARIGRPDLCHADDPVHVRA
jgi:hypothetical protein